MLIQFLKANNGDAILINFLHENSSKNILIDGGTSKTYEYKTSKSKIKDGHLKLAIADIKRRGEKIDLLILTHVDSDHIGGILKWFETDAEALGLIKQVWFNSGKTVSNFLEKNAEEISEVSLTPAITRDTGIDQGVTFEKLVRQAKVWDGKIIKQGDSITMYGLQFRIVSPSVENLQNLYHKWEIEAPTSLTAASNDYKLSIERHLANITIDVDDAPHNGSSIAFILTFAGRELLFLADAHPNTVEAGLEYFGYTRQNPINAEFVKLSHHGSNRNISNNLLASIDSTKFIISSDGSYYGLPNKQCLARIIKLKPDSELLFNYPSKIAEIFTEEDRKFLTFTTKSLEEGIKID